MGGCCAWLVICAVMGTGCRFNFDELGQKDSGPIGGDDDAASDGVNADPDAAIDGAALVCPPGYNSVVNETSRYKVLSGTADWLVAEQACEMDGTHLVVLDSANEKAMMISLMPVTNIWTGVTDRKALGQWLKVTGGVAAYLPWANSEPDLGGLECVQIEDVTTNLRDQSCSSGRVGICECDGLPAMPSTY